MICIYNVVWMLRSDSVNEYEELDHLPTLLVVGDSRPLFGFLAYSNNLVGHCQRVGGPTRIVSQSPRDRTLVTS